MIEPKHNRQILLQIDISFERNTLFVDERFIVASLINRLIGKHPRSTNCGERTWYPHQDC